MSRYLGEGCKTSELVKTFWTFWLGGGTEGCLWIPVLTLLKQAGHARTSKGATATLHCLSIKIMANLPKCTLIYITYHITILQVCNYSRPKFFALSNIHFPVKPVLPPLVGFRSWAPELSSLGPSISRTLRDPRTSGVGPENPLEAAVWESIFLPFFWVWLRKRPMISREIFWGPWFCSDNLAILFNYLKNGTKDRARLDFFLKNIG